MWQSEETPVLCIIFNFAWMFKNTCICALAQSHVQKLHSNMAWVVLSIDCHKKSLISGASKT